MDVEAMQLRRGGMSSMDNRNPSRLRSINLHAKTPGLDKEVF